ncbi:MAG: GTPase Era, partial [Chloroflexus sp.]|nr:GTPase Era [Chloroflexus sp.]
MKYCSLDTNAGTLYLYFTDLEEGQATATMEYPVSLLLDAQGAIFGCRVDLDDEVILSQLELILDAPYNWLDGEYGHLYIRLADEDPTEVIPLSETAILDLDDDDLVLGIELALPPEWRTPERLQRLMPLMVSFDDEPVAGEGPVVLTPPPAALSAEPST